MWCSNTELECFPVVSLTNLTHYIFMSCLPNLSTCVCNRFRGFLYLKSRWKNVFKKCSTFLECAIPVSKLYWFRTNYSSLALGASSLLLLQSFLSIVTFFLTFWYWLHPFVICNFDLALMHFSFFFSYAGWLSSISPLSPLTHLLSLVPNFTVCGWWGHYASGCLLSADLPP